MQAANHTVILRLLLLQCVLTATSATLVAVEEHDEILKLFLMEDELDKVQVYHVTGLHLMLLNGAV